MHGKVFVRATQDGDKVVLVCLHGSFSNVVSVYVWWDKLVFHVFCGQVTFELSANFVVHSDLFWCTPLAD